MTPIEAILKNVAAMALLVWLFIIMPKSNEKHDNFWILTSVTLASVLALFMLAPIQPIESSFSVSTPEELEIQPNYLPEKNIDSVTAIVTKDTVKKVSDVKETVKAEPTEPAKHKSGYAQYFSNIDNGRKTLCFFVPGCDHCRVAAKELTEMKKTTKNFPDISIIFMNEEADLIPNFFKYAGAEYPYKIIEVIPFWKVLGDGKDTPGVKYLWNGNDYKYYWGIGDNKFDAADFQKLISKPYSELKK